MNWHAFVKALEAAGVDRPARYVWRKFYAQRRRVRKYCHARGLSWWWPLVPEEDFYRCVRDAVAHLRQADPKLTFGDYVEFGVSRGTSLASAYRALRDENLNHIRLIGFDSFQGLPPETASEGWKPANRFEPGDFHSTLGATRRYLKRMRVNLARVVLIEGWFKDTLIPETRAMLGMGKASLIMVDCDIYSASRDALRFCAPLIVDKAVVIFDDWGCMADVGMVGEKESFEEFLIDNPNLHCYSLPSYTPDSRVFLVSRTRTH